MDVDEERKRCHTIKFRIGRLRLDFNPVVTILSAALIWTFVSICMAYPIIMSQYMKACKTWVTQTFTWFYIGSVNVWIFFIIVVYFSKYGDLKLGKDEDEPEFNDATYFTMLFAAGIGVGFFYFGVAEPIYHYEPGGKYGNRYWGRHSDNQKSQDAINVTLFHWGFHGWIVYTIVGLALGLIANRKGLPMTIRSCFYPILGNRIYGYAGDVIDIISIVSTMFGICASLGAGAMTMNSGLSQINTNIKENVSNQIIIIWVITFFATMSVISGLKLGIRRLSEICFSLGVFIMLCILFYDKTFFLLNLIVQSFGYYVQNFIQLGYHTDAYAQLGNAPDGKHEPEWMRSWTIAYWGWWISWSPFVGMFIAKISRGRTVKNYIRSTLFVPVIFAFLWFIIVGGAGLNMEREAYAHGINCSSPFGGKNSTESADGLFRLSCRSQSQMYFDLIQQYSHGVGTFLRVVSMISILLYFVTSSDSGSLVIDCLSANGSPDPPIAQRIFWALTEGATATALLTAGGKKSIDALLGAAVTSSLPFTPVICLLCVSIWKVLKQEHGDEKDKKGFSVTLFEVFEVPSSANLFRLFIAIVAPWWPAGFVISKLPNKRPWCHMLVMALLSYTGFLLCILESASVGWGGVGGVLLLGFVGYVASIRLSVREHFQISGNVVEDFAITALYPFVVYQLEKHVCIEERQKKDDLDNTKPSENDRKVLTEERKSFIRDDPNEQSNWV